MRTYECLLTVLLNKELTRFFNDALFCSFGGFDPVSS